SSLGLLGFLLFLSLGLTFRRGSLGSDRLILRGGFGRFLRLFLFLSLFFFLDAGGGCSFLGLDLDLAFLEELEPGSAACIAQAALVALDDARVAARPILEARTDVAEQLGDDAAVVGFLVIVVAWFD